MVYEVYTRAAKGGSDDVSVTTDVCLAFILRRAYIDVQKPKKYIFRRYFDVKLENDVCCVRTLIYIHVVRTNTACDFCIFSIQLPLFFILIHLFSFQIGK